MIRLVQESDAKAIVEIYNYFVEHTVITFEETIITEEEMRSRIKKIMPTGRWIVYESEGVVCGYAYASNWRSRIAYRNSLETTVYLNPESVGYGIGTKLYRALLNIMRKQGLRVAIGCIALPNENSVRLHEKLGFRKVGVFHEVGYKFGQWIDVGFWEKGLDFDMEFRLEPLSESDSGLLEVILHEAIYVPEGHERPSRDIIEQPVLKKYITPWTNQDMGLKIIDKVNDNAVGAIWLKMFEPGIKGYGYVADDVPELSMALLPAYRSMGIGTKLMEQILKISESKYKRISLSVDAANEAKNLYERFGFKLVKTEDGTETRLLQR